MGARMYLHLCDYVIWFDIQLGCKSKRLCRFMHLTAKPSECSSSTQMVCSRSLSVWVIEPTYEASRISFVASAQAHRPEMKKQLPAERIGPAYLQE